MNECIVILSTGQSGSSVLAELVKNKTKYNVPKPVIKARFLLNLFKKKVNKNGYNESRKIVNLNEEIYLKNNLLWYSSHKKIKLSNNDKDKINKLYTKILKENKNIILKDQRINLMLDDYFEELKKLKINFKYIFLYRNPESFCNALKLRNGIRKSLSENLWLSHNSLISNFLYNKDHLLISYEEIFNNLTVAEKKINLFLGLNTKLNFESPFYDFFDRSHTRNYKTPINKQKLNKKTLDLYKSLNEGKVSKQKISFSRSVTNDIDIATKFKFYIQRLFRFLYIQ